MLKKAQKILLTIFLSASLSTKAFPQQSDELLRPNECKPEMNCACFTKRALEKFAGRLNECTLIEFELQKYREFSTNIEKKAWYEDGTFYYLTILGTALVGGVVGYSVGKR